MNRRALLAAAATGLAGFAGCAGRPGGDTPSSTSTPAKTSTPPSTSTPETTPATTPPLAEQGVPPTICETDLVDVGIDAIDEPAFATDWSGIEVRESYAESGGLAEDHAVVGIVGDGVARAYPLSVLWWHEIVNDVLPGAPGASGAAGPLLVTYCSLCRSGMVARRLVDGEPTTFGVSGQLWTPPELETRIAEAANRTFAVERSDPAPGRVRNTGNLVMVDLATGSYWSQLLARAICGPRRGSELVPVPARTATWADWRAAHPDTEVLLPPPHSGTVALSG